MIVGMHLKETLVLSNTAIYYCIVQFCKSLVKKHAKKYYSVIVNTIVYCIPELKLLLEKNILLRSPMS